MSDDLTSELNDAFPAATVEPLGPGWRVLVPSPRWAHEYVAISVEPIDGGWLLSDSGEVRSLAHGDADELTRLLICAGADVDTSGEVITMPVFDDEPLASRILSFAHQLIAAPLLWGAKHCLDESRASDQRRESPTRHLARETRERLVARIGGQSHAVIQLDRRMRARGESVRAPLAIAAPNIKSPPRLVAAFVDMEASEAVVTSAKRLATWTFEVVHELSIPKYFVVRGNTDHVRHFSEFYDHHNVTAVDFFDERLLEDDARTVISRMRLSAD